VTTQLQLTNISYITSFTVVYESIISTTYSLKFNTEYTSI